MKMNAFRFFTAITCALAFVVFHSEAGAQALDAGAPWFYRLTDGSLLTDDCPICDSVTIPIPMRGTFELHYLSQGPLSTTYSVQNIAFTATNGNGRTYHVTGEGIYTLMGQLAVQQTLTLAVAIDDGITNKLCYFTNASRMVSRRWPMLQISVDQTNGTGAQTYHLDLNAAPFREIWFATTKGFTAGIWNPPTNSISSGDLLSSAGRVIRRNAQLTARLALQPLVPDLGLKDIDILTGGEIAFSITRDVFSESLGTLHAGDLLSDQGRILGTNGQLIAAFSPSPTPSGGAGLNAVQITDWGEIWFSVQTSFYSKKLGVTIQTGDLLSNGGAVVRTGAQLLAAFNPASPDTDYGLTALYAWPNGEFWFATAQGFYDKLANYYAAGDLLSDAGYVVYRNTELVSAFNPPATSAGFGLGALYLISDVTPAGGPGRLGLPWQTNQPPASLAINIGGAGRVFQLERATNAIGPYVPASSLDTAGPFVDRGVLTNQAQAFYRLHQW